MHLLMQMLKPVPDPYYFYEFMHLWVFFFRYVNGTGNVAYFLFDSHYRWEPGFFILIKVDSLLQIERCIKEAYQISGRVYLPYFEVQFVSVSINADDLGIIQSSQINYFRRMKKQQTHAKRNLQEKQDSRYMRNSRMFTNFECFRKYEEVKKAKRICKESKARKLLDVDNQAPRFYSKISDVETSLHICVVCNWCLYRRSMGLFDTDKLSVFSDDVFRFVSSFDSNLYNFYNFYKEIE